MTGVVKSGLKAALAGAMALPTRYLSDLVVSTTRRRMRLRRRLSASAAPFYATLAVELPHQIATTYVFPAANVLASACAAYLQRMFSPQSPSIAVGVSFDLAGGFPTPSPVEAPLSDPQAAPAAAAISVNFIAGIAVGAVVFVVFAVAVVSRLLAYRRHQAKNRGKKKDKKVVRVHPDLANSNNVTDRVGGGGGGDGSATDNLRPSATLSGWGWSSDSRVSHDKSPFDARSTEAVTGSVLCPATPLVPDSATGGSGSNASTAPDSVGGRTSTSTIHGSGGSGSGERKPSHAVVGRRASTQPGFCPIPWSVLEPVKVLGKQLEGTYGVVFKAKWSTKTVAVKIFKINSSGMSYSQALKSLENESDNLLTASANQLNDNIVKFLGIAEGDVPKIWIDVVNKAGLLGQTLDSNAMLAIVTRWEDGGTLHDLLHSNKPCVLPVVKRMCILVEIAQGLYHLHNNEKFVIVHGDIKPANVLLSDKMSVRLADFGLAVVKEEVERNSTLLRATSGAAASLNSSASGTAVGTWAYMYVLK